MSVDFSTHKSTKDKWILTGVFATLIIVLVIPFSYFSSLQRIQNYQDLTFEASADFVGKEKCKECHRNEYEKWQNSYHDRAMDIAETKTVLGDFNNVQLVHNSVTTRFFKKNDQFFVNTIGADGEYKDFQITHTFGYYPLQQYLIPFEGGRLQCLTIAWDDVLKKWYALPNHTDDHTDWLHWTGQGQNWNGMCAECHVTNFEKGYDIETDSFKTKWSEMDVSCEACHGPGSKHVDWAQTPEMGRPDSYNYNLSVNTRDITANEMVEICARCHSRRASLDDFSTDHKNIMDYMVPSLLTRDLYYSDGQILDEVYVYGSFLQSKMFSRSVKCNDCHDVHNQKLKQPGNALCLSCHRADTYDTKEHHFHKKIYEGKESKGDDCIQCHMPQTVYMGIDERADHSIRIPRPDLSANWQTPNPCNAAGCHADKSLAWTNEHMTKWYGVKKRAHFGEIFARARQIDPKAQKDLIFLSADMLSQGIVRATALSLLRAYPSKESFTALEKALSDPDALVRQTAISLINQLQFDKDAALIFPLLYDPVKAVRIQAALGIAALENLKLTEDQTQILDSGIKEYISSMQYSADFPSGRHNLALIYQALGQSENAIKHYKKAIQIDRLFIPAANNLAMLYNARGDNENAVILFEQILENNPGMYDIEYSLGLLLVEEKKYDQALVHLQKAANGLLDRARVHYNLGLLLQYLKNYKSAEKSLLKALELDDQHFDYLFALADHYVRQGQWTKALAIANKMIALFPENKTGYDIRNFVIAKPRK